MIVVDSSAIFAVALGEDGADDCRLVLKSVEPLAVSAATLAEIGIVATMKGVSGSVHVLVNSLDLQVVSVDKEMAGLAIEAHRRYGKGRHPATLNFGDCFSYALAKQLSCPLLFIGNDFSQTDIESAL